MQINSEKRWVLIGLIIACFALSALAFFTKIPAGGADNFAHFNISRWAFRYPHLFLDHWGKPVFTLLTAPIAQTGIEGVRIFNTVAGLMTAWFTFRLVKIFNTDFSWTAAAMTVFTPIYLVMMSTAMTETLFSLALVVSIYLFFKEKYIASALLVSFIFLIRTEGAAFLLLFLIAFSIKKQYKAIPFLVSGFLLFSLIGYLFHYHDFWWLITRRPYATGGASVYGSGNWFHFLVKMPDFLGVVIALLLVVGTVILVFNFVKDKWNFNSNAFLKILLILGCFWGYFFAHSYLWWKGETSAGLLRVMAGVSPLAAVIGVVGLNFIIQKIKNEKIRLIIVTVLMVYLGIQASLIYKRSVHSDFHDEILNRVTRWLKESGSLKHKLVVHNPYFAFSTGIDAWDNSVIQYGFSDNNQPGVNLPDSTIFIWDAQFSANEGRLPLEKILKNPDFKLIALFEPEIPFKVLGNNDYKIVVFQKIQGSKHDNSAILQKLKDSEIEMGIYHAEIFNFEHPFSNENLESKRLKTDSSFVFNMKDEVFSPAFIIHGDTIKKSAKNKVRIKLDVFRKEEIDDNRLLMVLSAEKDNKSYYYATYDINEQINKNNVWVNTEFIYTLPDELKNETVVKAYIWNIDKKHILIDNFKLEIAQSTVQ